MTSAVAMIDDGFSPPSWEQVGYIDESLAPTRRTPEGAAHKPAARVKGWPRLPGYKILAELGRGGMAFVYQARDLRRQRLVAIKVSDPSLAGDGEVVARFRQEQLLAARLAHPNLVAAYDAGQVEGLRTSSWSLSRATTWPGSFSGVPCRWRKPVRSSGRRLLVWNTCTSTAWSTATSSPPT